MSVEELAALSGISKSHLSHVETGSESPSDTLLHDLAQILNAAVEELANPDPQRVRAWLSEGAAKRQLLRRSVAKSGPMLTRTPTGRSPVRRGALMTPEWLGQLAAGDAGSEQSQRAAALVRDIMIRTEDLRQDVQKLAELFFESTSERDE